MNQLPTEIKYQLVFDEEVDGPELAELFGLNYQEFRLSLSEQPDEKVAKVDEIESDKEEDLPIEDEVD